MISKTIKRTTIFKVTFFYFLLITNVSFSQSDNKDIAQTEISKMAEKMFVDMNNRDYDAILEMSHPSIFKLVPKDQVKILFKNMLEGNEEFSIELPKSVPAYKISEIFKENKDNLEYAFVSYNMMIKMTFNNQKFNDEAKEIMTSAMKLKGMEAKFITENSLNLTMNNSMTIILKDDSTKNKWAMINYNPDSPFFYQVLPTSLLETAKEYKRNLMLESKKRNGN